MKVHRKKPRILIVIPDLEKVPPFPGNAGADQLLTDQVVVQTAWRLRERGANIHLAVPDYRCLLENCGLGRSPMAPKTIGHGRIHLARDRAFYYVNRIHGEDRSDNVKRSLVFQREVLHDIVPRVRPDLIHCTGWMTGLIPAASRRLGIPSVFTIDSGRTETATLAEIEERGIDAAAFWQQLYYLDYPLSYDAVRESIPVDLLTSGVYAADALACPRTGLLEKLDGEHAETNAYRLAYELAVKTANGWVVGIEQPRAKSTDSVEKVQHLSKKRRTHRINDRSAPLQYADLYRALLHRPVIDPEEAGIRQVRPVREVNPSARQAGG